MSEIVWFKSSHSSGANECVEIAWSKSRHCNNGTCLEWAMPADAVLVRDSKEKEGPILSFSRGAWSGFVAAVRGGRFSGADF